MTDRERVKWVDVAKFIGIFAIYLGHFCEDAGNAYHFVFQFHVPLFFFLSGCMSNYDREKDYKAYFCKKTKMLMLPFCIFAFSSLLFLFVKENAGLTELKYWLIRIFQGSIRNTFFVDGLWFISCLYVLDLAFKCFKKICCKSVIFFACLILSVFTQTMMKPNPLVKPNLPYNIDSAMYYILYYAAGYLVYPYIHKLFQLDTKWKKGIFLGSGLLCAAYACCVYVGKDYLQNAYMSLEIIGGGLTYFYSYFKAALLIWLILIISRLFERVKLFGQIGRESLYLCGNEYLIKSVMLILLNLFGTELQLLTPMHTCIYTLILVMFGVYLWIPAEKRIIKAIGDSFMNR